MGSSKTRSICVACVYPSRFVDFFVRCTAVSKAITQMSPHMSNMKAMSAMKLFFFFNEPILTVLFGREPELGFVVLKEPGEAQTRPNNALCAH